MAQVLLNIDEPATAFRGPVMLASGHRPFFLMAGLYGTAALPAWVAAYLGYLPLTPTWHGHEMIFGFAVAAIAGFLMAAVPKWTRTPAIAGWPLVFLIVLWVAGRVAMWAGQAVFLDLLFLPALGAMVLAQLLRARNARNYQVAGVLFVLAAVNGLFHFHDQSFALRLAILMVIALVSLIGGRIIPAFTQNALRQKFGRPIACATPRILDVLAVPSVLAVVAAELFLPGSPAAAVAALAAALVLAARMAGWQTARTLRLPLVWVLHVGYAWVPVGFLLMGLAGLGAPVDPSAALHALTAGAIGVMILAVASRAALGHSGRALEPSPLTVLAYVLVIAAAVVRVFVPWDGAVTVAGGLWFLGYGLFAVVYWPILTRPRIDGLPG
ncbi:MAG: NnrS family protein [Hyphomicrobiales bacterium]|nr:NnrS family protein [Hyphomicrobiales bacterium]